MFCISSTCHLHDWNKSVGSEMHDAWYTSIDNDDNEDENNDDDDDLSNCYRYVILLIKQAWNVRNLEKGASGIRLAFKWSDICWKLVKKNCKDGNCGVLRCEWESRNGSLL